MRLAIRSYCAEVLVICVAMTMYSICNTGLPPAPRQLVVGALQARHPF